MVMPMMAAVMAVVVTVVQAVPAPPTVEQMKNATYMGIDNEPITLKDGTYAGTPFRPDSPSRPRVALLPATLITGDLNGDGTPEAAVLLSKASGGNGVFTYLAVAADNRGKL